MVYIASWQEYQEAAESLYAKSPNKVSALVDVDSQLHPVGQTRYSVKWRSSEGKLVLKITDDTTCIKFKTCSSIFLNRFESLNLSLMQKMQNRRPDPPPAIASPQPLAGGDGVRAASPVAVSQTGAGGGGVKKKKPKKKK